MGHRMTHQSYDSSVIWHICHNRKRMPTKTFKNLPDNKRERVFRAAVSEFAANDFASANLDRIAGGAEVPKGSLYQYFEGKEDLYLFTVDNALGRSWELFKQKLARTPPTDCFDLFGKALMFICDLERKEPDYAKIYARVGYAPPTSLRDRSQQRLRELNGDFQERLIRWGVEEGLIDPGLDRDLIAFVLDSVANRLHGQVLLDEGLKRIAIASRPQMGRFVPQLVAVLRRALAPPATRGVAVGAGLSSRLPHRSGRAGLPHPAPTSGSNVKKGTTGRA